MSEKPVAVLFARSDSVYKSLPGCDVYDIDRDAMTFEGGMPVIAHPPCRSWGRLAHRANPRPGERKLALWAVDQVRQWGGYWSILMDHGCGKKSPFRPLGEGMNLAVSLWWYRNGGSATKPKK